jgi:hypothetical protein
LTFLALQVAAEMLVSYTSLNGYVHNVCVYVRSARSDSAGSSVSFLFLSLSLSISTVTQNKIKNQPEIEEEERETYHHSIAI